MVRRRLRLISMDKEQARLIQENQNALSFRYCPRCGRDKLRAATVKSFECPDCGFGFFLNTAAAVGALITDEEGRLLVTVRKGEPAKGTWDLPGGFADPGESVEETVRREIKEELGLDIISLSYFVHSRIFTSLGAFHILLQMWSIGARWPMRQRLRRGTMWRLFCSYRGMNWIRRNSG